MSYFEDQEEAWLDGGCQGDIMGINPDEYWADKISNCDHKKTRMEKVEGKSVKVCTKCDVIL